MVIFIRVFKLDSMANPTQGLSHKFCLDYRVLIGSTLIFFINQNDIVLVLKNSQRFAIEFLTFLKPGLVPALGQPSRLAGPVRVLKLWFL